MRAMKNHHTSKTYSLRNRTRASRLLGAIAALGLSLASATAQNATAVADFGDGGFGTGWQSDDTRNSAGDHIKNNSTHLPLSSATLDPTAVAAQINWRDFYGSRGNLGGLWLNGTSSGSGKSSISVVDTIAGLDASGTALGSGFQAIYRWQNTDTVDAGVAVKFGVQSASFNATQTSYVQTRSGEAAWDLLLVYDPTEPGNLPGNTVTNNAIVTTFINQTTGKFYLFGQAGHNGYWTSNSSASGGIAPPGFTAKTLSEWAADPTWGTLLFGGGAKVSDTQFGIGSGNANASGTVDWASVSFLNSGSIIDFTDASKWTGNNGTIFSDTANWRANGAETGPTATNNVVFDGGTTLTTTVDDNTTARSIGVVRGNVTIDVASGKTLALANNGFLSAESGASLSVAGNGTTTAATVEAWGTVNVSSRVDLNGGTAPNPPRDGTSPTSRYGLVVGPGGVVNLQKGANVTISQAGKNPGVRVGEGAGTGTLNIADGASLAVGSDVVFGNGTSNGFFTAGDFGSTGVVNQSGGTFMLTDGSFNLGNQAGTGTYNLSNGTATLRGGLHSLGRNTVNRAAGTGTLNISGGTFEVTSSPNNGNAAFILGDRDDSATDGVGIVTQTGGTFRVAANSNIYLAGYGNSTFNLNGGTLEIGGNSLNPDYNNALTQGGTYQFNLGGGTIKVIGSNLNTSVQATLTANTTSTVNTNGLDAAMSGNLTGTGTLSKEGVGTLSLTGANAIGGLDIGAGSATIGGVTAVSGPAVTTDPAVIVDGGSTLNVASGGTLNVQKGQTRIGSGAGQSGTLAVNGGAAHFGTDSTASGDFARVIVGGDGGTGLVNLQTGTLRIGNAVNTINGFGSLRIGLGAGSQGQVNQTGGTFNGSSIGSMAIGQEGNGTYNMSGGNATIGGVGRSAFLHVGRDVNSVGAWNISGNAQVTVGADVPDLVNYISVGSLSSSANGSISQSGNSTVTLSKTMTHIGSVGFGTYSVTDNASLILVSGVPNTHSGMLLGSSATGVGVFTQSGSSLVDFQNGGRVNINANVNANSSYNLNGGTLQIGGSDAIHGAGAFNLGGGTLKVTGGNLTTSAATNLIAATTSTVDSNGFNATFGLVSGNGTLNKAGAGNLAFAGGSNIGRLNLNVGSASITSGNMIVGNFVAGASTSFGGAGALAVSNLSGGGTITVETTISGTHSAGFSAGLQEFTDDVTYLNTAVVDWELFSNSVANRGSEFDAVNLTGNLTINAGASFNLVFNGSGSAVDFSNSFWSSNQSWTFIGGTGTPTGSFAIGMVSLDSLNVSHATARAGSSFSVSNVGNDVLVQYAIPEPSTLLFLSLGLTFLLIMRRRTQH